MSQENQSAAKDNGAGNNSEKPDLVKYVGLGFLAGLIVAVLTLEYYGYIKTFIRTGCSGGRTVTSVNAEYH